MASLFPYISIIPISSDTQPWSLALSIIGCVFLSTHIRLYPVHLALLLLATASVGMLILEGGGFGSLRNAVGYLSMFFISIMATYVMRDSRDTVMRFIDISIMVWLTVGIIQRLYLKDAFTFLLGSARTTETRGVISLAPEPTYFATMILLMLLWRASHELKIWHGLVLFVVVILLAASAQIVIVLLISAFVLTICLLFSPRYYPVAIAILTTGGIGAGVILVLLPATRLGTLVQLAIDNPSLILLQDASANERFVHIFAGLRSIVDKAFLPNGLITEPWREYINTVIHQYPSLFWVPQYGDRVYSAVGAILFQMGFLCLALVVASIIAVVRWSRMIAYKITWSAAFVLTLLTALPLSHPLIGVLFGVLAYMGSNPDLTISRKVSAPRSGPD